MSEKTEIADRLREEVLSKFGSIKTFGEAIQKTPQYLNVYLSGINAPGPKLRRLLEKAGLDVAYVMSGRKEKITAEAGGETHQIFELMKEKGIRGVEELRERLEREESIRRLFGSDIYSAFLEVAVVKEKQLRYETKKKKRR